MSQKEDSPYFAPAATGEPPEGEVPTWGEDAQNIAREVGLGSYGPVLGSYDAELDVEDPESGSLQRRLDRLDAELSGVRVVVAVLNAIVFTLSVVVICVVGYLFLRR